MKNIFIIPKEKPTQNEMEEVECNNCGYIMSLKEDESIYICTNFKCTSCYDEEFTEHCGDCYRLLEQCTCIEDTVDMKHQGKQLTKEEVMEQRSSKYEFIDFDERETLEEAAERYVENFTYPIAHPKKVAKNAFINGAKSDVAKWQQQNSYSEEEVLKMLLAKNADLGIIEKTSKVLEFIKQFKNK